VKAIELACDWQASPLFSIQDLLASHRLFHPAPPEAPLIGDIDEQHRLQAQAPQDLPAGRVRLIVLLPDEDDAGGAWESGIAKEWSAELSDARQDIYTLEDGQPVNATE